MMTEVWLQRSKGVDVDPDADVKHIDEFDIDTIQSVSRLVSSSTGIGELHRSGAAQLSRCDYVKFTEYYRVRTALSRGSESAGESKTGGSD